MSSSPAKSGSNGQRAAAVQRLKAAVAERRRARELREESKRTNGTGEQVAGGNRGSKASSVSTGNRSGS